MRENYCRRHYRKFYASLGNILVDLASSSWLGEKFYSCCWYQVSCEEEVTTIDDINNVVTIPVAAHTNSNDEEEQWDHKCTDNASYNNQTKYIFWLYPCKLKKCASILVLKCILYDK